jgi:hypothetical protein
MTDQPAAQFYVQSDASALWASGAGNDIPTQKSQRQHIMTVAVDDWFQIGSFGRLIEQEQWYRFETRF